MSRTKKIIEPHYELLYIVSNKYTEQETAPIAEKISKLIKDSGGEVTYTESWGKKKFAYPIEHFNHGYYFLIEFDLLGSKLKWVDTETKHMTEILRHQIVSKKKRSLEEITNENRIIEKQAKRAAEKKAEAEAEELRATSSKKPLTANRRNNRIEETKSETTEIKKETNENIDKASSTEVDSSLENVSTKNEEKKPKTKEEVQLNLDKLDEKLDKILDTDDLL